MFISWRGFMIHFRSCFKHGWVYWRQRHPRLLHSNFISMTILLLLKILIAIVGYSFGDVKRCTENHYACTGNVLSFYIWTLSPIGNEITLELLPEETCHFRSINYTWNIIQILNDDQYWFLFLFVWYVPWDYDPNASSVVALGKLSESIDVELLLQFVHLWTTEVFI